MRTARCVAIHTVPSNKTTPSTISAQTAKARCNGDAIDVTRTVASTRMNMADRVIATIRIVVTKDARTVFMA